MSEKRLENAFEFESFAEMSAEDFQTMLDQLPELERGLKERKMRLEGLREAPGANLEEIARLSTEIDELKEEIAVRKAWM